MALCGRCPPLALALLVHTAVAISWTNSSAKSAPSTGAAKVPNATADIPELKHEKEAGAGYLPGSPYYARQVAYDNKIVEEAREITRRKDESASKAEKESGKDKKDAKKKATAKKAAPKAEAEEKDSGDHPGGLMALGIFLTIALFSMVTALLFNQNTIISSHAWFCFDQVILIFLAVMNFQAFGALMDCCIATAGGKLFVASLQAFGLFFLVFAISWTIRKDSIALAVLCGGGAHFTSFASIHVTEVVEDNYAGDDALFRKLIAFAVFGLVFFCFSCGIYLLKRRAKLEDDNWNDKITDTENDFVAMAMAVVWTTFVFHLVLGKDHDLEVAPSEAVKIPTGKEVILLSYAIILVPISIGLNRYISSEAGKTKSMIVNRIGMFLGGFASMASCWTFLFLGQMYFYSRFCIGRPLFGRIIVAMITNLVAAVGIVILAKMSSARGDATLVREVTCALTALSLATGWSWEQTFDAAMDASVDHFGTKVHHLKLIMSLGLVLIILPTYVSYIKPVANKKTASLG